MADVGGFIATETSQRVKMIAPGTPVEQAVEILRSEGMDEDAVASFVYRTTKARVLRKARESALPPEPVEQARHDHRDDSGRFAPHPTSPLVPWRHQGATILEP